MTRGTVSVSVLIASLVLQPRLPANTRAAESSIDIQSFTAKGSIDFADHRQPRKGTFQIWYQGPDKFLQRERIVYVERDGLRAGQPADTSSTALGFDGNFAIFDGTWPGPPDVMGRGGPSIARVPTQADVSVLRPAVHQDCADWLLAFRGSSPDEDPLSPAVRDEVRMWRQTPSPRLTPDLSSLSGSWMPKMFSDYRQVGSLLVPYRAESLHGRQEPAAETWQTEEFRLNVEIDPKIFKHK